MQTSTVTALFLQCIHKILFQFIQKGYFDGFLVTEGFSTRFFP